MDFLNITLNLQTVPTLTQGFGIPAVIGDAEALPPADIQVITFQAAFITGNIFNCKVNGQAIAPITFATTSDAMLAAIAAALRAIPEVYEVTVTAIGGTTEDDRVITVTAELFTPMAITEEVITGGAGHTDPVVTRTATAQRIAFYTTLAEMVADGYATTDFEYIAAQRFFAKVQTIAVINKVRTVETWVEALDDTLRQPSGGDWFRFVAGTRDAEFIEDIMTWAMANLKVFYASSDDDGILSAATDDLASVLKGLTLDGALIYSAKSDGTSGHEEYIDAALAAVMSSYNPGQAQADAKQLTGVTPSSELNTTQKTNAWFKNCNTYAPGLGVAGVTAKGICCSGQWIDIIEGAYCYVIKLGEAWASLKLNSAKLPFTDLGLARVEDVFRQVSKLMQGASYGFLESYTIITPKAADFSLADKANRLASGFIINGILTNGIVSVGLTVNLTF